jgi:predicted MarR family transcription regulator
LLPDSRSRSNNPASPCPPEAALAEMELGTVGTMHAFQRWIVRCMEAAGQRDLTAVDVLVLHHLNRRTHDRRLANICFILNIEDSHVVAYSLRKLAGLRLVTAGRHGKEAVYSTTQEGRNCLARYREIREQRLLEALGTIGLPEAALEELAGYVRWLWGLYDQAARAAASL